METTMLALELEYVRAFCKSWFAGELSKNVVENKIKNYIQLLPDKGIVNYKIDIGLQVVAVYQECDPTASHVTIENKPFILVLHIQKGE